VSSVDAYLATVERRAKTETSEQRLGEALQQSVKKFIARHVDRITVDVNGKRVFAAEETSL
jgi:hypothetical protein